MLLPEKYDCLEQCASGDFMDYPIDIIIPWVDGNDPECRNEKSKYDPDSLAEEIRFETWDNLQYVFRGIEKHLPWFRYIFFVTWGHLPEWLIVDHPKLKVVKHTDYIPSKYLPTFNSNTIEMNYHRIDELSEHFILFNDDLYPLQDIPIDYYFRDGIPCAESVETHFVLKDIGDADLQIAYANVNNITIINDHFNKRDVVKNNHDKWFSPALGEKMIQNIWMYPWNNFESFVYPHEAKPMRKSVLSKIWNEEPLKLDRASMNKFRSASDVTQRLISQWQVCSGDYIPRKAQGKIIHINKNNIEDAVGAILNRSFPILSINEDSSDDFQYIRDRVNNALETVFPEKSSLES